MKLNFINLIFKKKSNIAACFTRGRSARDYNLPQEQFGSIKKKYVNALYRLLQKGSEITVS